MLEALDHPFDRGAAFELAHAADFAEAEALDGFTHAPIGADRTADKLDANFIGHCIFSHDKPRSRGRFGLVGGAAAETVDILRAAELRERLEGRFHQAVWIRRAPPLGSD